MAYGRSILAVIAGYLLTAIIVIVGSFAAASMMGEVSGQPSPSYLVANLTTSLIAAVAGGAVAARIATFSPIAHSLALSAILVLLGLAIEAGPGQPGWYRAAILAVGAFGAVMGGLAMARRFAPITKH